MKRFFLFIFVFATLPVYCQLKITNYVFNIDGLQSVKKFYSANKSSIDKMVGDTITAVDIILYTDILDVDAPLCCDHVYVLWKKYVFENDENKEVQTFYARNKKNPNRFEALPYQKAEKLRQLGEFKSIKMPCKFIIEIPDNKKQVIFKRLISADLYIEEKLQ